MRDVEIIEQATGRVIGTARIVDDIRPGQLVLRFRAGEFRVEEMRAAGPVPTPAGQVPPPNKRRGRASA